MEPSNVADAVASWARGTFAIGLGCGAFGALRAAAIGAPLGLMGYSAGANGALMGGAYLALRAAARSALPPSLDDRVVAAAAGAATGAIAYGLAGGLRRAPAGSVVLALLAAGAEEAAAGAAAWREGEAQRIIEARGGGGAAGSTAAGAAAPRLPAPAPSPPPPLPPPSPPRPALPGDTPLPHGHSAEVREGFLSFLPVSMSQRSSDLRQLEKRRWRLRELDELLGFAEVEVDPRAAALLERERAARATLKRLGGA